MATFVVYNIVLIFNSTCCCVVSSVLFLAVSPNISATGYGPSTVNNQRQNITFDGDERKFELWEIKFLGYMKLKHFDWSCGKNHRREKLISIF